MPTPEQTLAEMQALQRDVDRAEGHVDETYRRIKAAANLMDDFSAAAALSAGTAANRATEATDAATAAVAAKNVVLIHVDGVIWYLDGWQFAFEYPAGASLVHEGVPYRAIVDNEGIEPGTDPATWMVLLDIPPGVYEARDQAEAAAIQAGDYRQATGVDRAAVAADRSATGSARDQASGYAVSASTSAAIANSAAQGYATYRTLAELQANTTSIAAQILDGSAVGLYFRETLGDPDTAWYRASTDTVLSLSSKMGARALAADVGGHPLLSAENALEVVVGGVLLFAIELDGTVYAPGRVVLDSLLRTARTDEDGTILEAVGHYGSVYGLEGETAAVLDPNWRTARTDDSGHILEAVGHDGSVYSQAGVLAAVLDPRWRASRTDEAGAIIEAVGHDGSLYGLDGQCVAVLDPLWRRARTDEDGTILDAVGYDGSVVSAAGESVGVLDAAGGIIVQSSNGAVLSHRRDDGVETEAADYAVCVHDGDAYLWIGGSEFQITAGGDTISAEIRGGLLRLVREVDGGREWKVTPLAGWYPELPFDVAMMIYSSIYGQSLGAGDAAGTPVNPTMVHERALQFVGGQRPFCEWVGDNQGRLVLQFPIERSIRSFDYTKEQETAGQSETSSSGFSYELLEHHLDDTHAVLTTTDAIGSANWAMLVKDSSSPMGSGNAAGDPWRHLVAKFIRARLFWALQGLTFVAGPLRWNQGEGNYADSKALYTSRLQTIGGDWQDLAEAWAALLPVGHPRAGIAPMVVTQMCSGNRYGAPESAVPSAQLNVNIVDPDHFLCCGPIFDQAYNDDGVHPLAAGQEMQGARQGVATGFWLTGADWYPISVAAAVKTAATTIRLTIRNVLDLPLVFDTSTITGLGADQGFTWRDNGDGNAPVVTGAAIINNTRIDLTLDVEPTGTGGEILIAMNGDSGEDAGPVTGNRATLRTDEEDGPTTKSGAAVHHFICIDRVAVTT